MSKARCHTALAKAIAHWSEKEPNSEEAIRPECAPHNALETYVLAGCAATLGFIVCQDLLGRFFEMGTAARMLLAVPLTPFFLQIVAICCLPLGRWVGDAVFAALSIYLVLFLPMCPLTWIWIGTCGLNFTCWIFQSCEQES